MPASDETLYHERLWPGLGLWAVPLGFAVSVGIAVLPASPPAAVVCAAVVLVVGLALGVLTAPVIAVEGSELRAGRAHVPVAMLGAVEVLDPVATRAALGPDLDARAFVCLRGWVRTAVKVELEDPRDPTPYWFVSSRRPALLAEAIETARATSPV